MPREHELVWHEDAAAEFAAFLKRRKDRDGVRECVERHLFSIADNIVMAQPWEGPADFKIHLFQCQDGKVKLYLRAILELLPDGRVGVLNCGSILF